ncbi:hypothetical protein L484_018164 [Morus notabilis]|uniref:Uncharacterized protein n=1 Tax=Morus notabilis TaxID=981085 RepID=W9RYF3_9ROSA|nr:hypothetical protein L484_018164 [Morus notabilis]
MSSFLSKDPLNLRLSSVEIFVTSNVVVFPNKLLDRCKSEMIAALHGCPSRNGAKP